MALGHNPFNSHRLDCYDLLSSKSPIVSLNEPQKIMDVSSCTVST
jgi:hypothetical protein